MSLFNEIICLKRVFGTEPSPVFILFLLLPTCQHEETFGLSVVFFRICRCHVTVNGPSHSTFPCSLCLSSAVLLSVWKQRFITSVPVSLLFISTFFCDFMLSLILQILILILNRQTRLCFLQTVYSGIPRKI